MAKKGKGNKPSSARGHVESNVIRFREKRELIRVDRYGNPLNRDVPFNVMSNDWLASHKHNAPPEYPDNNPPPDNVTSIGKNKPSKPASTTGNEAEQLPTVGKPFNPPHGWLHEKHLAANEFRNWSRITKEVGRNCKELWTKDDKGKLHSDSLDLQRKRSIAGHNKLKFEKPPSINHNPLLSEPASHGGYAPPDYRSKPVTVHNQQNRKLDRKFWDMSAKHEPKAPSGIPISEFITGKFKPTEKSVVYTTPQQELPPTPTRDWRASNDSHYRAQPVVDNATTWARQTKGAVQWFINHVEPQNWPTHIHNFVRWMDGSPVPNTGAINKAASHPETELILMRSINDGLKKDWHMLDQALLDSQSENNLLRQELQATKNDNNLLRQELEATQNENNLLGFELAHHTGDTESVEEFRKALNVVESKTPRIPDDVDSMLRELRMYQSFERVYGPEHAFARFVYGKPELGQVMREQADMNTAQRQWLYEEREALRRIGSNMRTKRALSGYKMYPNMQRFRNIAALYRIKNNVKDVDSSSYALWWKLHADGKGSIYYSRLRYQRKARDVSLFHHWGNKVTVHNRKKPVDYQQVINNSVGVKYFNPNGTRFAIGLKKRLLMEGWKGDVIRGINKITDVLNTEVNPFERRRMKKEETQRKQEAMQRKAEKAERRKRKQAQAEKEAAKRAFRMVH